LAKKSGNRTIAPEMKSSGRFDFFRLDFEAFNYSLKAILYLLVLLYLDEV